MTVASNPNDPIFYVYVLVDPRKPGVFNCGKFVSPYEPFYIGKGKGDRFKNHHLRSSVIVKNKISAIKKQTGKSHKAKLLKSNLTEAQAYAFETKIIKSLGIKLKNEGPLLNMNEGGPGVQQGYVSVSTRVKRAKSLKAYWDKVKANHTEYESRTRNMKGIPKSDEARANMSAAKLALFASKRGDSVRHALSKRTKAIAKARSPEETRRIYAKASETKRANKLPRPTA